jgi:methanogenic corrinoid protein MtbC1
MLKSRGVPVIYLGTNVPMKDIEYVVKLRRPDFIYSHLTTVGAKFNFSKFLTEISTRLGKQPIVISGQLTQSWQKKIQPPISFKKSYTEVMEFISSLR